LTVRIATERDREWFVKSKNKTVTKKKKKETTQQKPLVSDEFLAKIHEEYSKYLLFEVVTLVEREQNKKEIEELKRQEKENEDFLSIDLNAYPEDSDEESPQKKQKLE
jgi:hypothetical protein